MDITLRPVEQADLPSLYAIDSDEASRHMAAFGPPPPADLDAYTERWQRIQADPNALSLAILADNVVVGNIGKFILFEQPTIGYVIARSHWGRGIASAAVRLLLAQVAERPLYARAASDNAASRRVLEKCGFVLIGEETNFAEARQAQTAEVIMRLEA